MEVSSLIYECALCVATLFDFVSIDTDSCRLCHAQYHQLNPVYGHGQ